MDSGDGAAIAEAFYVAIAARDYDAVAALYADDVAIWHNIDGLTQTRVQNLDELRRIGAVARDLAYDLGRRIDHASGFVQLSTVRFALDSGAVRAIPLCALFEIAGGKIIRLDEYFDSAPFEAVEDAE